MKLKINDNGGGFKEVEVAGINQVGDEAVKHSKLKDICIDGIFFKKIMSYSCEERESERQEIARYDVIAAVFMPSGKSSLKSLVNLYIGTLEDDEVGSELL